MDFAIDYILIPFIKIFIVFNVVAGVVALLTLAERKVAAWIQVRLGPMPEAHVEGGHRSGRSR